MGKTARECAAEAYEDAVSTRGVTNSVAAIERAISAAVAEAVAEEREAIALMVDGLRERARYLADNEHAIDGLTIRYWQMEAECASARVIAAAIRSRTTGGK